MKTSTKGRARGGGRRVRPGRGAGSGSADSYRRQLTRVIAKLGDEELLRLVGSAEEPAFVSPGPPPGGHSLDPSYRAALPFEIHKSGDADSLLGRSRERISDSESGFDKYMQILDFSDHEGTIADQALTAGLRVSIKCSPEYAPDIACAFAQRVPSRTIVYYDANGQRLVFRHEHEEAIHNKQESEEK